MKEPCRGSRNIQWQGSLWHLTPRTCPVVVQPRLTVPTFVYTHVLPGNRSRRVYPGLFSNAI